MLIKFNYFLFNYLKCYCKIIYIKYIFKGSDIMLALILLIGLITFLGITQGKLIIPMPAEERLDPTTIKFIVESTATKLNK